MIQVYTGNGKGKTTAAIGLAIRSLGAGHKVYMMQFMKSLAYSEQGLLHTLSHMTLETTGKPFFIAEDGMMDEKTKEAFGDSVVIFSKGHPPADYVALLSEGLHRAIEAAKTGEYDLIVLDEINVALAFGVLKKEQMECFLENLSPETELVCTGRNAPQWLLDRADLITEMKEIRHYYDRGIPARKGIEN
jgi:cob(I)yrinic acid a,c-diamide adenosyltransferase